MRDRPINLPCTGIASFCKAPVVEDLEGIDADVTVLGIPWDEGTSFRPGTRLGPRDIRNHSVRYAFKQRSVTEGGYWDMDLDRSFLQDVRVVDAGDVDVIYTDVVRTFGLISEMVSMLLDRGTLPVLLGGDHSITFPIVRAFSNSGPLSLVQFDAHLDYFDSFHGVVYSNGNPIKRIAELPFIDQIVQIGMRGIRAPRDVFMDSVGRGNTITAADIRRLGVEAALDRIPRLGPTYVTVDIDVLDPSIAPGTGSPEFDGLQHWQLKQLLCGVVERAEGQVKGFDLVEVNPLMDSIGQTATVATQVILELMGAVFESRTR